MINQLLELEPYLGIACLYWGVFVFGYLAGNTSKPTSMPGPIAEDMLNNLGIDINRHYINQSLSSNLGLFALYWINIYCYILSSFWVAFGFFIFLIFSIVTLNMTMGTQFFYFFWRTSPFVTSFGFYLSIRNVVA